MTGFRLHGSRQSRGADHMKYGSQLDADFLQIARAASEDDEASWTSAHPYVRLSLY
jgi:hypothetical protein